ncbi:HAD family hydrolase [Streptomyces tateyamensis]|nr:HAD family hydrolase [Streptomyces tateyamensis]
MPLLLLDLDNTLLPRDSAFRAWAKDFLADHGLPAAELGWLTTIDGGGYIPRETVLSAAKRRYGLNLPLEALAAHYRRGINSHIHCPTSHLAALRTARAAGWTLAVVSNGATVPQREKMRRTGVDALVDAWVVSEEAGCAKPDPLIFEIAAQRCGLAPDSAWRTETWMVGDHGPADIAGARLVGIRSVWLGPRAPVVRARMPAHPDHLRPPGGNRVDPGRRGGGPRVRGGHSGAGFSRTHRAYRSSRHSRHHRCRHPCPHCHCYRRYRHRCHCHGRRRIRNRCAFSLGLHSSRGEVGGYRTGCSPGAGHDPGKEITLMKLRPEGSRAFERAAE